MLGATLASVITLLLARSSSEGEDPASDNNLLSSESAPTSSTTAKSTVTSTSEEPTISQPRVIGDSVELVADFRATLTEHRLNSANLSDDQIFTFGSTICVFAVGTEQGDRFDVFRDLAVADSESGLSENDLALTIDAALVVFCPGEAERLGISLSP